MKFKDMILTACQSLKMNPKRSLMTIIGIIIGIASVITIMAIGNGVNKMAREQIKGSDNGQLNAEINYMDNTNDSANGFDESDTRLIKSSDIANKINKVTISSLSDGVGQTVGSINGTDSDIVFGVSRKITDKPEYMVSGHFFKQADLDAGQNQLLIDKKMAKKYFELKENAIGKSVTLGGQAYTVIGVFSDDNKYFNAEAIVPYNAYIRTKDNEGSSLQISVKRGENPQKIGRSAQKLLNKSGTRHNSGEYSYKDTNKMISQISKILNGLTFFVSAVAGISLFIAGIGVMNMMYISVSERTQEIGIRLAVGATEANIRTQFLIESIILTVVGGSLGLMFGYLIALGTVKLIPGDMHIKAIITFSDVCFALGVSTLVGVIFGWLPAKQASNKNLIDILR
ncbi:ABC transporter permease [Weissella viridescens]|uniref:ABC transporter permease n=1 Tax=Weissella viridescens TaxID=1629 RepID=UPI003AF297D8